eukprot:357911-Chlamydomonas_euryale.AAC.2
MQPCSHAAMGHAAMRPCGHATMQPCNRAAVHPCSNPMCEQVKEPCCVGRESRILQRGASPCLFICSYHAPNSPTTRPPGPPPSRAGKAAKLQAVRDSKQPAARPHGPLSLHAGKAAKLQAVPRYPKSRPDQTYAPEACPQATNGIQLPLEVQKIQCLARRLPLLHLPAGHQRDSIAAGGLHDPAQGLGRAVRG